MRSTNCPQCGRPIEPTARRGRPRIYCSDACKRQAWDDRHGVSTIRAIVPKFNEATGQFEAMVMTFEKTDSMPFAMFRRAGAEDDDFGSILDDQPAPAEPTGFDEPGADREMVRRALRPIVDIYTAGQTPERVEEVIRRIVEVLGPVPRDAAMPAQITRHRGRLAAALEVEA